MSKEIQTIVFDLGGVLIDWNPRYVFREIFKNDEEKVEWFLSTICTPEWNAQQDAGRTMDEATEALVSMHPQHETHIRAYYERWQDMLGGPIDGTVEILREVREGPHRLYGLTNWSAETFPVALERYDFLSWFEGIVVSGKIGLIKPHAAIYHHLVETFDLEPAATVFIDDSPANVEAARDLGFRSIRFEGPAELREALRELGVRIKE
jgi:2-haloacid dehalogenase